MRVLFAGTPEAALPTLEALIASEHDVVGVLTRADARKGRGRTLHPSPVAAVARDAGLDVRTPATLKGEQADDVHAWVGALKVDVAVVVAYGRLVPADLLEVPEHGWLNLHFSLLPAWRGAAPVQRAVIAGEEVTGACVFRLEEGLDTGPVYGRLTEAISGRDTSGDLLERLAQAGAPLVLDVLRRVEDGSVRPEPQEDALATLAPVLSSADGLIRWEDPALAIDRRIRGVTPVPEVTDLLPGQLRATKREVLVGTGGCAVRLGQVAPAGRSWMPADAWARGARPEVGAVLGTSCVTNDDGEAMS